MKIENYDHMVIIHENLLDWYDESTDSLYETAPLFFKNGTLVEISEKLVAIEKEEGFVLQIINGIGEVEEEYV